jgi:beta-lactamase regulating signal transducer with metallopeptidase domain/archaellum component FlaC
MDAGLVLLLGSIKALLLLTAATGISLSLRRQPARIRVVVLATALAGSLAIPVVAPLVPTLPLAVGLPNLTATSPGTPPVVAGPTALAHTPTALAASGSTAAPRPPRRGLPTVDWRGVLLAAWAIGAALAACHLLVGLWRMDRTVRRVGPVTDQTWLVRFARARRRVGCRRQVRLVVSPEVEIPATVGAIRPTVVLPTHAESWTHERALAVLEHELVHVVRHDWLVRVVARLTRACYWFNPLAWWVVRRLDLEQEMACDEEVLSLGTRASSYACHLLGIAHAAVRNPAPAHHGLEMARRSHLEERIMTILNRTHHRRVGLTVLVPVAVLMAAMVPALAAVYPGPSDPVSASAELRQILTEMRETEASMESHLERIEQIEIELKPHLESLESFQVEIDHEAIEDIERRMQPYLERIEQIEIDMQPVLAQIEEFEAGLDDLEIHIEDGTLAEVQRQIHEQIEAHMEQIESVHVDMEPFHRQIEELHRQLEPLHRELEQVHVNMEPVHREMEEIHESMEPFHERMEEIHRELEPFHERMEQLGDRLEQALRGDVAAVLRRHLSPVTAPGAPIDEAAARILEDAHVHVHDELVEVDASRRDVRQILVDLLGSHRIGTEDAFDAAVDDAADALSPLSIAVD